MDNAKTLERTDLTKGSITKKLVMFALPIIAGNIIMQLYNAVDAIVVGQFVGSDALAAVTVSFPVMWLFMALLMGLSVGANILIAQYRGAGDYEKLEKAVNTAFALSIVVGVVMTVLGVALSRPLLVMLGTPANIMDDAVVYLQIVMAGTMGSVIFYLSDGLVRGLGDARWPLYAMIVSSLLNIVLDLVFVIVFRGGVAGAAIATSIAYFLSGAVLLVRFIQGRYNIRLSVKGMLKTDRHVAGLIIKLGVPSSVQSVAMSAGAVIIQIFANNFGSDYIAASGIVMRVDGFAVMPMFGISAAITTFVGQNIGAGNLQRSRTGINKALQITIGVCVAVALILYFFGIYLMRAFTDNRHVLDMGLNGLRFLSVFYVLMGINQCIGGAVRGAGAATVPAVVSITCSCIRIPFAYLLAMVPFNRDIQNAVADGIYATVELAKSAGIGISHYMGLFYSMGISMACGAVIMLLYYRFGDWQTKSVVTAAPVTLSSQTE